MARHTRRERRSDLAQAPLSRLSGGQEPASINAELHRRGDQKEPEDGRLIHRVRTQRSLLASVVLSLLLLTSGPAISPVASQTADSTVEFMPLSEVKPGMEATIRTVFEGDRVEEFQAEILAVMESFLGPNMDLIVARLKGDRVKLTGVAAGMSGSPVYINGRLV